MALGVPGRLRPQIISTFGTTRVVGRQPYAPAAFTPVEIPGTHFQSLSRPQGTWFCRKEPRKKSSVTPSGIDPGTVRLVAQRHNYYATPGPKPPFYTPCKVTCLVHFLFNPLKPSGYSMYHQVHTLKNSSLWPHSAFVYFVWIGEYYSDYFCVQH